jgi:hypothetical protein
VPHVIDSAVIRWPVGDSVRDGRSSPDPAISATRGTSLAPGSRSGWGIQKETSKHERPTIPKPYRRQVVKEAILGWAWDGKPYTAEEVRDGIAISLGVTPELQTELFRPYPALAKWENYVAHGLSWLSRPPKAHHLGQDGFYRLTELGKVMASRVVDPTSLAEIQKKFDKAVAALTLEEDGPADGDHQISKVEAMLDDINETAMELATNSKADADVLVNHIEELTAALRTIWPKMD